MPFSPRWFSPSTFAKRRPNSDVQYGTGGDSDGPSSESSNCTGRRQVHLELCQQHSAMGTELSFYTFPANYCDLNAVCVQTAFVLAYNPSSKCVSVSAAVGIVCHYRYGVCVCV